MNRNQRIVLWLGLAIVAGMALFPPRRVQIHHVAWQTTGTERPVVDTYRYGFVLARPSAREGALVLDGGILWERVRRRGLVVLLVTYALMALLRTPPRGGGTGEDDDWDGRDDVPPPPEPHPVHPHRELVAV